MVFSWSPTFNCFLQILHCFTSQYILHIVSLLALHNESYLLSQRWKAGRMREERLGWLNVVWTTCNDPQLAENGKWFINLIPKCEKGSTYEFPSCLSTCKIPKLATMPAEIWLTWIFLAKSASVSPSSPGVAGPVRLRSGPGGNKAWTLVGNGSVGSKIRHLMVSF